MSDPEDFLSDALEVFYDYAPITQSTAGSIFTYTLPQDTIQRHGQSPLSQCPDLLTVTLKTPETQAANWALHASSIWMSSLYMMDHLDDLRVEERILDLRRESQDPLHVLELGAGAGLPSIVLSKCYGDDVKVTASDYPDDVLIQSLRDNVDHNGASKNCSVIPHAWGADALPLLSRTYRGGRDTDVGFDLILAADTLWNPDCHILFLRTLQSTLRKTPSARIWIIAALHTGKYTLRSFIEQLSSVGLEAEMVEEREVRGNQRRPWSVSVEDSEKDEDKERRKWVVCMSIKWIRV